MEWLNYHHLFYFWNVARCGSVSRAGEELRLTQATVSAQVKSLELAIGEKLFRKSGRHLTLTDMGKVVF
ncbi:MAG TPA: LysR family transcriptional regulator, partial [Candidatus Nitrosocosmicus sp.]|nr:LysR family transcriptional regulator [Candidatus Nitrosocosmicus sp.]